MGDVIKICKNRQEQVDLLNEILRSQPDFIEGMDIAAVEIGDGEVQWRGNPINDKASAIYARVLEEHLPKFKLEEK